MTERSCLNAQQHRMNRINGTFEIGENQQCDASYLDRDYELSENTFGWCSVWKQKDIISESDSNPMRTCKIESNLVISRWGL